MLPRSRPGSAPGRAPEQPQEFLKLLWYFYKWVLCRKLWLLCKWDRVSLLGPFITEHVLILHASGGALWVECRIPAGAEQVLLRGIRILALVCLDVFYPTFCNSDIRFWGNLGVGNKFADSKSECKWNTYASETCSKNCRLKFEE